MSKGTNTGRFQSEKASFRGRRPKSAFELSQLRTYDQLDRVTSVAVMLLPLRYGCTVYELHREIRDNFKVCERTVRRDLQFLEVLGLVEVVHREDIPPLYRWCGTEEMNRVLEAAGAVFEERRVVWAGSESVAWAGAEFLADF